MGSSLVRFGSLSTGIYSVRLACKARRVSLKAKLLQTKDLSIIVKPVSRTVRSDQARLRLREEMERNKLTQREVADLLGWSQSRVAKLLTGRVGLDLDDLESLCFAIGLSVTEAVRDHGLEFCAEMTPTELRILDRIRQLPRPVLDAVMTLLDIKQKTNAPERHAGRIKKT